MIPRGARGAAPAHRSARRPSAPSRAAPPPGAPWRGTDRGHSRVPAPAPQRFPSAGPAHQTSSSGLDSELGGRRRRWRKRTGECFVTRTEREAPASGRSGRGRAWSRGPVGQVSRDFCERASAAGWYRDTWRGDAMKVRARNWRGARQKAVRLVPQEAAGKINSVDFCLFFRAASCLPRLCPERSADRQGDVRVVLFWRLLIFSFARELLRKLSSLAKMFPRCGLLRYCACSFALTPKPVRDLKKKQLVRAY